MMVVRTGVDLSSVSALERRATLAHNDFIGRYWTEGERAESNGKFSKLAARWAAKEAAMKALGWGIGKLDPTDIEVVTIDDVPTLRLHRGAISRAEELGLRHWSLSLSHEGDLAVALVVAIGETNDDRRK
jgi:holo-[acyl-carrier protein] synthase